MRSEVGTPMIFMPASTFSASSRTNSDAVEPVPMPSRMPSSTWPSAVRAASIFNALGSIDRLSSLCRAAPTIFGPGGKGLRRKGLVRLRLGAVRAIGLTSIISADLPGGG